MLFFPLKIPILFTFLVIQIISSIDFSWGSHHSNAFHLKHYRVTSPGECGERAHHSHSVHLGSNGGCETLNLRSDRCIEILRNDCTYEFYVGDQCRGELVSPNRGEFVGSVKVKACSDSDHGFRLGWWKRDRENDLWHFPFSKSKSKLGRTHHHDKTPTNNGNDKWYWEK